MYQMHSVKTPNLTFTAPEQIAPGVIVNPVDFTAKNTQPPFTMMCFHVLPGCSSPVDQHQVQECWIIINGSGVLEFASQKIPVTKNDILHFASFEKHQIHNTSNETLIICSIYW